jgi:hypothetical protein
MSETHLETYEFGEGDTDGSTIARKAYLCESRLKYTKTEHAGVALNFVLLFTFGRCSFRIYVEAATILAPVLRGFLLCLQTNCSIIPLLVHETSSQMRSDSSLDVTYPRY